jgi:transcriptional regulator with XRE-family HTH domain
MDIDDLQAEIGKKLRERRLELGLKQEGVAEKCGVATSTIQRIESGTLNPTLSTIVGACDALGFPVAGLFMDVGSSAKRPDLRAALGKIQQGIEEIERAEINPKNGLIRDLVSVLSAFDEPQIRGYLELFRAAARSGSTDRDDLKKKGHRLS